MQDHPAVSDARNQPRADRRPHSRLGRGYAKSLRVTRLILVACGAAMMVLASGGTAAAQSEPTVDEVGAQFVGTTIDDWTGAGFVMTPDCVTAAGVGAPAELGAMGFHAVNPARIDFEIDAAEPEVLLVDGDGNIVGFEYEVPDQSQVRPALFGVDFDDSAPHPGFDQQHWSLHVWTIDNPLGKFSPWNPNLNCPAGAAGHGAQTTTLAVTGSETPVIAIVGITFVLAGLLAMSAQRRLSPRDRD